MEDTGENSALNLALRALRYTTDNKPVVLVGNYKPNFFDLLKNELQEKIILVVNSGHEDDFAIEAARREMTMMGLNLDLAIEQLKPPPVFPIEEFRRVGESINPFKKKEKSPDWKNKLKSLYRVKI